MEDYTRIPLKKIGELFTSGIIAATACSALLGQWAGAYGQGADHSESLGWSGVCR